MSNEPTPQQEALASAIIRNEPTVGIARAGSGKTSTAKLGLLQCARPALALAFNKSIQLELQAALAPNPRITVKTLNGLGHSLWGKHIGRKLTLKENKSFEIVKSLNLKRDQFAQVFELLNKARTHGLVPAVNRTLTKGLLPDTEESWNDLTDDDVAEPAIIDLARRALHMSIQAAWAGQIDFTDQIYMPACAGTKIYGYEQVLVDEAQDLNPLQHAMLSRVVGANIQAIGDPLQSIYGFRGAVADSMEALTQRFSLQAYPLTMSFRCAYDIITEAQQYCPDIEAAPWAQPGEVREDEEWTPQGLPDGAVVLCRINAPLIKLAFQLIRARRRPNFRGRDLGKGLESLLRKLFPQGAPGSDVSMNTIEARLEAYVDSRAQAFNDAGRFAKAEALRDKASCIYTIIDNEAPRDMDALVRAINFLFREQKGGVELCSIHRSKGLEWDTVFWLDNWNCPSKRAIEAAEKGNPEPLRQETNLRYVATTRAKARLIYINSPRRD